MSCRRVRTELAKGPDRGEFVRNHLQGCAKCAALAVRYDTIYPALQNQAVAVDPPAHFARRIGAQLADIEGALGWAALKLLPATLVVLLALSWLNFALQTDSLSQAEEDPTGAITAWLLDPTVEVDGSRP